MVEIIEEYVEIKEDDVIPSEILIYLKYLGQGIGTGTNDINLV